MLECLYEKYFVNNSVNFIGNFYMENYMDNLLGINYRFDCIFFNLIVNIPPNYTFQEIENLSPNYLMKISATLAKTLVSKFDGIFSTKVAFLAFKSMDFKCSQRINPVVEV